MNQTINNILTNFTSPKYSNSHFISIEGIEGAGKTAQLRFMQSYLEGKGYTVTIVREPGGTKFGEGLRSAILESTTSLSPVAEAYLFASSRAQLLKETILNNLEIEKNIIICDRYIDSSLVYQGYAGKLGIEQVMQIHNLYPLNTLPNITFYLKVSIETSIKRMDIRNNDKDYFESKGEYFFQQLVNGYDHVKKLFPDRIHEIDGEQSEKDVSIDIQKELDILIG
ncbi:MAG: dTMP kinase [Bdellovibrionales bacterium]|jgi:dTMP kinase|nr:dTMP kinase [Bdellovibrionales bacterium]